ncbi:MAG: OmpA family protein, partial [Kiritimatiellia bacterium]
MFRRITLSGVILASLLGIANAQQQTKDIPIEPSEEVQSFLRALSSTNVQERQILFSTGTEEELRQKLADIQKMAGGDKGMVLQLLYFSDHASGMEQVMLPGFILEQLAIPNAVFAEVCLPLLDSEDESTRGLATNWLTRADHVPNGGVDFSRYEGVLREKKQNPSQGLIRYMYGRNSQAAVLSMSRVYGDKAVETELADKLKVDPKAALQSLAERSEWWAHLYVATMVEKDPDLQTPDIMKRLHNEKDPLVREILARLPVPVEASSTNEIPVASVETVKTVELHIPFESDKADIGVETHSQLDEIVEILKTDPQLIARIEGHTDKTRRSAESYSKQLTARRAQAVLDYLVNSGGIEAN